MHPRLPGICMSVQVYENETKVDFMDMGVLYDSLYREISISSM